MYLSVTRLPRNAVLDVDRRYTQVSMEREKKKIKLSDLTTVGKTCLKNVLGTSKIYEYEYIYDLYEYCRGLQVFEKFNL